LKILKSKPRLAFSIHSITVGIIQRQSIKGTIYSYIGVVLGFVTTGLLYPFILSEDEIGVTKLLMSYSALAAQLAGLGFNGVTVRLFPYFRDEKTAHKGFLYLAILVLSLGFIIGLGGLFILEPWILAQGAEKSAIFAQYFRLIYPLIIFQLVFATLDNYYTQLYNSTFAFFLKELFQRSLLIVAISSMYFGWLSFDGFIYAFVSIICLPTLLLMIQIWRDGHLTINPTLKYIDKELWRQIVKVGAYSILTSFTGVIILNIDSIMLAGLAGIGATGIYAINYFFGVLVKVPSRPMIKISNAVISESWNKNDVDNIVMVYKKSTVNQMLVGSFLLLVLLINIDSIYEYLPQVFSEGKWVLILIAVASWFEMATGVSKSVIGTSHKYMVQSIAMIGLAVVVVITNLIFIPRYGITGAAVASFISLLAFNLFRFAYIWYRFKMQPYSWTHLKILLLGTVLFGVSLLLPHSHNYFIDIPYRSALIALTFGLIAYKTELSEDVNSFLNKLLKRTK
jgi:O-antigen/teichoic acid export membrane protein